MPTLREDLLILEKYQKILEAMARRDFLKLMGRGAVAASVAPKGALLKAATNMPGASIDTEIMNGLKLFYPVGNESPGSDIWKTIDATKKLFASIPAILSGKGIRLPTKTQSEIGHLIQFFTPAAIKSAMKEQGYEDVIDYLQDNQDDISTFDDLIGVLFDNNLVSEPLAQEIFKRTDKHWWEFSNSPKARAARKKYEDDRNKELTHKQYARDINYSRSDYAGGSEDTDYSNYTEKTQNFQKWWERRVPPPYSKIHNL